jgi:hypothetical protein
LSVDYFLVEHFLVEHFLVEHFLIDLFSRSRGVDWFLGRFILRTWVEAVNELRGVEAGALKIPTLGSALWLRTRVAVFAGRAPLGEDLRNGLGDEGWPWSPPLAEGEHDGKEESC